jgi:sterol desaturase/sphingolipid hydroxylase (fatty acid hydroxylase superfamily)
MAWDLLWWYVLVPAFAASALAETYLPFLSLPSSTPRRWINNTLLLLMSNAALIGVYQFSGLALTMTTRAASYGVLNRAAIPYWAQVALGFAALDLASYFVHRLSHSVWPLWRLHQVHHSETDIDLTTAFRFHPIEGLYTQGVMLTALVLLGPPVAAVGLAAVVVLVMQFFAHVNVRISERTDRLLRLLIITPTMHRYHHSKSFAEQNTNFGTTFSLWDRLFGTYFVGAAGSAPARYGLDAMENGSEASAMRILLLPFRRETKPTPDVPLVR